MTDKVIDYIVWYMTRDDSMIQCQFRELLPQKGGSIHKTLRVIRSLWFPGGLSVLVLFLSGCISHTAERPTILSQILVIVGLLLMADSLARVSMYLYYSTTTRVLNSIRIMMNCRKSFCSRQVAIALYGNVARKMYREMGYRWYHVLPDGTFTRKCPFLRKEFWRAVFFPKLI